jgi:hypothetical protein
VVGRTAEMSLNPFGNISTGKKTPLKNVDKVVNIQFIGSPCLNANIIPADINPIPDKEKINKIIISKEGSKFEDISMRKTYFTKKIMIADCTNNFKNL